VFLSIVANSLPSSSDFISNSPGRTDSICRTLDNLHLTTTDSVKIKNWRKSSKRWLALFNQY